MASTVLTNGIIIPEKYSRDWYSDLYHNWQELDNLLGGGTPKDGTLTIQKNGTTIGTFSANQATDETINIEVPTKTSDLTNDSNFVESSDLATVATSGSYNDLDNKPTIPTVNNATLTIQKNGTNVQTFTANQSTNATANITVPTKTSDLTNDSGFITEDTTKIPLAGSNQISGDLIPSTNGTVNLGSTVFKWKTLNGLNPGALSLPNSAVIDIVSTIGQYLKDNNTNIYTYTAPFDGWICVGIIKGSLRLDNQTKGISNGSESTGYWISLTIPFVKNDTIEIKINKMDATDDYVNDIMWKAYINPCQGNI